IQAGKLPRKCGLTVVRHGVQYELTLHAETLAVGAAKIPPPDEEADRARLEARAQQLRDLIETLELLFDAFGRVRFSADWPKELARMQRWLSREERRAGGPDLRKPSSGGRYVHISSASTRMRPPAPSPPVVRIAPPPAALPLPPAPSHRPPP